VIETDDGPAASAVEAILAALQGRQQAAVG
jgi:hypothetical protein